MNRQICALLIPLLAPAVHAQHLEFAATFGGTCNSVQCSDLVTWFSDTAVTVAVDAAGNSYVAGLSYGEFPLVNAIEPSPYANLGPATMSVPFVAKIDPTGTKLLYATPIGVPQGIAEGLLPIGLLPIGLAIDSAGNAYATGASVAAGFPAADGTAVTGAGDPDAFLIKLDPNGKLLLSMLFGGSVYAAGNSIAVTPSGVVYIAGITGSSDFPVTSGAFHSSLTGTQDLFLTMIDGSTGNILYSTLLGPGSGPQLALGPQGDVFIAASTTYTGWPTTSGVVQPGCAGTACSDAIVLRFRPSASQLVYATYLGGSGAETLGGIASDSAGTLYLTGTTASIDFPIISPVTAEPPCTGVNPANCGSKAFVAHLNSLGTALLYSTALGGDAADEGHAIAIDAVGDAYVTGKTTSTNFPAVHAIQAEIVQQACFVSPPHAATSFCGGAGFLTALNPAGDGILWSTFLGQQPVALVNNSGLNGAYGVTVDSAGALYVVGDDLALAATQLNPPVNGAAAILKIAPGGQPLSLAANSLVNAASYVPGLPFAGGLATLFVDGLKGVDGIVTATGSPLPTTLAGVSVKVGGELAPILAVASLPGGGQQINFQVPLDRGLGSHVSLQFPALEIDAGGIATFTAALPAAPGIFTLADGSAAVQHAADFSLVTPANPVVPGEILVIYATGLGPYTPGQTGIPTLGPVALDDGIVPQVFLAGLSCTVLYAGPAPGYVGLDQINCQTSSSQPVSGGQQALQIVSPNLAIDALDPAITNSNVVTVTVQ
ncbi:MAG: SBBP repeat-containing protein [Bryobacteraceae bacterium]